MKVIMKNLEIHLKDLKMMSKTKLISTSILSWTGLSQNIKTNQKLQNRKKSMNSTMKNWEGGMTLSLTKSREI